MTTRRLMSGETCSGIATTNLTDIMDTKWPLGSGKSRRRQEDRAPCQPCAFRTIGLKSVLERPWSGLTRTRLRHIPLPSGPNRRETLSPSPDVTVDSDGARHAIIDSLPDSTHSGFIIAAPQERLGLPQSPLGVTRFRVTFPNAGVFPYICALHDDLGMKGKVIVHH